MKKAYILTVLAAILTITAAGCEKNTVGDDTASASVELGAYEPVYDIILAEDAVSLAVGDTYTIEYTASPDDAGISFSSNNNSVTVDEHGTVEVLSDSDAVITVNIEGKALKEIAVDTFIRKADSLTAESSMTIGEGEDVRAIFSISPENASIKQPVWTSSDENIVTVSDDGTMTGMNKGTAIVTAKTADGSGLAAEINVSVTRGPYKPLADISPARYSLNENIYTSGKTENTATIMLTGDLMSLSSQQYNAAENGTYNFNESFDIVKDVFAESDMTIGNLETLTAHSAAYTYEQKEKDGNPNCNSPATYLDALRYAGFDAVVTANNHSGDAGSQGLKETHRMLDRYSLMHTGTFTDDNEQRFLLIDINGIKTAVLSYTELLNNSYYFAGDEERMMMVNRWSEEKLKNDIAQAKDAGAEFIIVYTHWGIENTHERTDEQIQHAQMIADAGADVIAGSHPHCLQKASVIETNDGRKTYCIYSMGNFVSSMARDINNDTVIIKIDMEKTGDEVTVSGWGYIPAKVYHSYGGRDYLIVPTNPELNGGIEETSLNSASSRIKNVMGDEITEVTSLN